MKLIIGLGNPGKEYADDRHNAGFLAVERLAERLGVRFNQKRARSLVAAAEVDGERVSLAKPQTYMNLSGEAVRRLLAELGVRPDDLLVVYDDVDLPLGTLRLRPRGGPGTHNGMRSIVQALGTEAFPRLRLGIGAPGEAQELRDYVLHPFQPAERALAQETLERAVEAMLTFIRHDVATAMNRYNR
ncbi:MAG: aminoacyl-tRNA hydrolase [Chloroflexi bacterium]|nr:aminoacyl-tRNA hydrolase [Chloroflexota bacterium]